MMTTSHLELQAGHQLLWQACQHGQVWRCMPNSPIFREGWPNGTPKLRQASSVT